MTEESDRSARADLQLSAGQAATAPAPSSAPAPPPREPRWVRLLAEALADAVVSRREP